MSPTPCPVGTYSDTTGNLDGTVTYCKLCLGGYYCDEVGLTTAIILNRNKICDAGYYCTEGATVPHPEDGTTGNICDVGNYCPSNSSSETQCAAGTYETRTGMDECQDCPEGFYCPGLGNTSPVICTTGYCPEKSSAVSLCPDGRFGNSTLLQMVSQDDCVFCPEGKYCSSGVIKGSCAAGYFCDFGATLAQDPAKACPRGHYCPAGT